MRDKIYIHHICHISYNDIQMSVYRCVSTHVYGRTNLTKHRIKGIDSAVFYQSAVHNYKK